MPKASFVAVVALLCYLHEMFHIHNVVYFKNSVYENIQVKS